MELDAWTIFAVGGVASLLIERFFYYKSKYKEKKIEILPKPDNSDNPGHGERIGQCETEIKNLKENNEKDHRLIRTENKEDCELIRKDISKLYTLFNKVKNGLRK